MDSAVGAAKRVRADQDSLLGNGWDTLVVTGGTLKGATLTVVAALPWLVEGHVLVDSAARLVVEPGAQVRIGRFVSITFDNGGRLWARGTAAEPVVFTNVGADFWGGLVFRSPPGVDPFTPPVPDTSYLTNALLERPGVFLPEGSIGTTLVPAVDAAEAHMVVIDSTVIRQSAGRGGVVNLQAPGSRISRSAVDTVSNGTGVVLGSGTVLEGTTVRGASGIGVEVRGSDVTLATCEITGSGSHGVQVSATTNVHINNCNLFDNVGNGVENATSTAVDATNNWWGDAAGPTGTNGDGVSANVTFVPFLTVPVVIP